MSGSPSRPSSRPPRCAGSARWSAPRAGASNHRGERRSEEHTMQDEVLSREARESFVANGFYGPFKVYDRAEAKEIGKEARIKAQSKASAPYPDTEINYDRHIDVSVLSRHIS